MAINNGTISVTSGSAVITGSGTTWLTDMVGQDDYLVVDGMGFLIKSADSETKLTLLTPYTGTTGSGKAYGIVHLTGEEYVRRAAREVTDLINKYSEIKNAVSVVAGRDLIPRADASGKISKDYIDTTQENLNIQNIDANKSAINAFALEVNKL